MVTQTLGYRYIWIDVLCIIQDSAKDWLHEAAEMRHVYSNAILTIAAERTSEHTAGQNMFGSCNITRSRPFPLRQLEDYTGEDLDHLIRSDGESEKEQLCIFPDTERNHHFASRQKGLLDTRGWILQEQLLSPRILYYGQQQMYWDCIGHSASELSPMGISLLEDSFSGETWAFRLLRRTIAGKGDPEMLARLIADVWIYVVQNYSSRTLTKQSDKLIAIQGVIAALERVLHTSPVAGMWHQDLWKQLIWWAAKRGISGDTPFPAPTWSWLSVDAPVSHHHSICGGNAAPLKDLAPLADLRYTVTDIYAEPTSVSAVLKLSTPSFSYTLTTDDLRQIGWKRWHRGKLGLAPAHWLLDRDIELPQVLKCAIIAEDEVAKMTVGLCLVADGSQPEIWKRIGLFVWEELIWQIAREVGQEIQVSHSEVV
ncbi:hypothetical protein E8E13_009510 [Curvularia kusanoi]|uniref:Heterokaryon incompatibility domain-containing protein n=1 Tax=Curvularia kusanoi TaxID=90978 RepID=A0A9P4TGS3_CURKU|nr:hypothetical protein E8E13_009510 [Curvularia kusanoi]